MSTETTLVVLAAGVGSRFGGLKQLEPVGPGGAALMDYTIFDALREGFGRVVLVVRSQTHELFEEHLERGPARHADVALVHQELDDLPQGFAVPAGRAKPWGTGHAVLAVAPVVEGPFAVVNADDYYGREGIAAVARFLVKRATDGPPARWAMVGYQLGHTLPAAGAVSRALCRTRADGRLASLEEIPRIWRQDHGARWLDRDGGERDAPLDALVSINLWGFTPALLVRLERGFRGFLASDPGERGEFFLPAAVGDAIAAGEAAVDVLSSPGRWCGITSPEDRELVRHRLAELVTEGDYPADLWRA